MSEVMTGEWIIGESSGGLGEDSDVFRDTYVGNSTSGLSADNQ